MGFRLHNQTVHKVEYGNGYFNHCAEEVNNFLHNECESFEGCEGEYCYSYSISVLRSDLEKLVRRMEKNKEEYTGIIPDKNYSVDDFINVIRNWINTSDYDNEWIYLDWF